MVFAIGQGPYNLLVCINFTHGQGHIWADLEVEERPVVPEEFPNQLGIRMEILTISIAIIICKGFTCKSTF